MGNRPCGPLFPDDLQNDVRARCATDPNFGCVFQGSAFGDNLRYFMVFDYAKTTSQITSPYVRAVDGATYFPAYTEPALGEFPTGTSVHLEFRGGNNAKGGGNGEWSTSIAEQSGFKNLSFRAKFAGSVETLTAPNFEVIAIPYLPPAE